MKSNALLVFCGAALVSLGVAAGCDSEVASERDVDVRDDKTITEETKVTETPSGDLKKTETKTVQEH